MSYLTKFDEINRLSMASWESYAGETAEEKEKKAAELADELFDFLIDSYLLGWEDTGKQLYDSTEDIPKAGADKMQDVIYEKIDGKTFEDRVKDHVMKDDSVGFGLLVENEFHRVYNASGSIMAGVASDNMNISKIWNTVGDDRVRDTHDYINRMKIPYNEEFYTYDNDHAMCPGSFEKAENNIGCRCWLTYVREDE